MTSAESIDPTSPQPWPAARWTERGQRLRRRAPRSPAGSARRLARLGLWLTALIALAGCATPTAQRAPAALDAAEGPADAALLDGAGIDAGTTDAGTTDAGTTDAGTKDAATTDAGTTDAGAQDAADTDAAATDAGATDAGPADAGTTDAGPTDAGGPDGAATDGAASDAGSSDAAPGDSAAADTGAPWVQPPVWDLAKIQDATTAKCTFTKPHVAFKNGVALDAWQVSYVSWESVGGKLKPITIRGFAARPKGAGTLPGLVQAHGLGGHAKESHALGVAALTGMFVVAYTGPGGGSDATNTSEGLPSGHNNNQRMFDVFPDVRGSWFWGHTVAAMRGLTCLTTRSDVDPTRLGITGYSAGGVVSHLAAGQDPRIKAAVPLSGVLAWDVATQSPNAWQHSLLKVAKMTVQSPTWTKLMQTLIQPSVALAKAKGAVFLVNGSSDEFFPLTAHMATWNAWPGSHKRMSIVGNYDHGVYQVYGKALPGGPEAITARATLRAEGAQRAWFRHWFKTDSTYATLPKAPSFQTQAGNAVTLVTALVDPGTATLKVDDVRLWWSNDKGKLWGDIQLDKGPGGTWTKIAAVPSFPHTLMYVDVTYTTGGLLPQRFSLSSSPQMQAGFVPDIWGMP